MDPSQPQVTLITNISVFSKIIFKELDPAGEATTSSVDFAEDNG